jgi:single-strand DNA-binding protein
MNKVILMGRLVADPELRYTQGTNTAVCRFRIAVDRYMGEGKENEADFITCTAWGKIAEFTEKYFFKGKRALVEGNIKTGSYEDNDGKKVYTTEVWVERIEFADDKKKDENGGQAPQARANNNPPWNSSNDDFPRSNQPGQQPAPEQSVNDSPPPWMR